jgi:hypothetical protein
MIMRRPSNIRCSSSLTAHNLLNFDNREAVDIDPPSLLVALYSLSRLQAPRSTEQLAPPSAPLLPSPWRRPLRHSFLVPHLLLTQSMSTELMRSKWCNRMGSNCCQICTASEREEREGGRER